MSENRPTRRAFLALTGGTALAGCNAIPNPFDSDVPTIRGSALSDALDGPTPTIPETVPVPIDGAHRRRHADRTRTLLSRAPLPFDERAIPNEAMREEMNTTAKEARSTLERARNAPSPFEALSALRNAREKARTVATAWAYADEGVRRSDLTDDAEALTADVDAFRDRWSYGGDDPVRALLVHETVETLVAQSSPSLDGVYSDQRLTWRPENLVTVSRYAGEIERARAALDDAAYLYDGLRERLETTRDLGPVFDAALTTVLETLQSSTATFGENASVTAVVDADISESPVREPLQLLYGDVARGPSVADHRDRGHVASALLECHHELARLRAFESLRRRVESADGDPFAVESAEDVASIRENAVSAIRRARRETNHPHLSRTVLEGMAELVEHVDDELAPYADREQVPVDWIRRDVGEYIYASAVARATPDASVAVADALAR